jgi:hypothetical protein
MIVHDQMMAALPPPEHAMSANECLCCMFLFHLCMLCCDVVVGSGMFVWW